MASNVLVIVTRCLEVSVIIATRLTFLIGTAHTKEFCKCTPKATKHALHVNFTDVHEQVISLGRSRLRALVMFARDMQIQVALCKQGCRLINIWLINVLLQLRRVTIVPVSPTSILSTPTDGNRMQISQIHPKSTVPVGLVYHSETRNEKDNDKCGIVQWK